MSEARAAQENLERTALRYARAARALHEWQVFYGGSIPAPDSSKLEYSQAYEAFRNAEVRARQAQEGNG